MKKTNTRIYALLMVINLCFLQIKELGAADQCFTYPHVVIKNESGKSIDVYLNGVKLWPDPLSSGKENKINLWRNENVIKVEGYPDQKISKNICKTTLKWRTIKSGRDREGRKVSYKEYEYFGYNLKYKKNKEVKLVKRSK